MMRTGLLLVLIILVPVALVLILVVGDVGPITETAAPAVATTPTAPPSSSTTTTSTTEPPGTTTSTSMPRSHETAPMSIASTGYCETGAMANGVLAHDGAVSSHVLARGSRWQVLDGAFAGRVFTVEDTGPLATFDIAMPGRCDDAVAYGRRTIQIVAAA